MSADILFQDAMHGGNTGTSLVDLMDLFLEMPLQKSDPDQSSKGPWDLPPTSESIQSHSGSQGRARVKQENEPQRIVSSADQTWIKQESEEIKVFVEQDFFQDYDDHNQDFQNETASEGEEQAPKPSRSSRKSRLKSHSVDKKPSPLEADLRSSEALICFFCHRAFLSCDQRFRHEKETHLTMLPTGDPNTEVEVKFRSREFKRFYDQRNESLEKVCCFCGSSFEDSFGRFEHEVLTHLATLVEATEFPEVEYSRFECHVCSQREENLADIQRHLKKAHFPDFIIDLICQEPGCSSTFARQPLLNLHIERHRWKKGLIEKKRCSICNHRFFDSSHLRKHLKGVHKTVLKPEPSTPKAERSDTLCSACGKGFKTPRDARMHEARVHNKECNIQCPHCDVRIPSQGELNRHLRKKHKSLTFKCPKCFAISFTSDEYFAHKCNDDFASKVCLKCCQLFQSEKKLRSHEKHCGARDFVCPEVGCGIVLANKAKLHTHLERHNWKNGLVEKSRCEICGMRFFYNFYLQKHLRDAHSV